jgi:hypothetical protein
MDILGLRKNLLYLAQLPVFGNFSTFPFAAWQKHSYITLTGPGNVKMSHLKREYAIHMNERMYGLFRRLW